MPRGRMLNQCISHSKKVAALSPQATLLFTWCIPHLDQKGRIYANTYTLKGLVTPFLDYMTHEIIEECKEELVAAKLVVIYGEGRFMQFIGFSHNQRIDPTRERPSEIPAPTEEEMQSVALKQHSGVTPDTTKHNITKLKENPPSAALQAALKAVFNDGLNIYALMTKIKSSLKQPAGFEFPEEVLLKTCEAYWREKTTIRQSWPWFVKVIADEWTRWNVSRSIAEGAAYKASGVSPAIIEILKGMLK